jgi:DNA-binding MarR family transcriptional regulator
MVCFNFYRGWRGISGYYRHYLPDGVSAQQSYILELCDEANGIDVGSLAAALEIDSPAISSLLRRMEASQLVRREVLSSNRRHTFVYLTPGGVRLRDEVRDRARVAERELLKHISEADAAQLAQLVEKIYHVAKARDAEMAAPARAVLRDPIESVPASKPVP